jgi:hypothetical protein
MRDAAVTVRRILKVNHAGEFGDVEIRGEAVGAIVTIKAALTSL